MIFDIYSIVQACEIDYWKSFSHSTHQKKKKINIYFVFDWKSHLWMRSIETVYNASCEKDVVSGIVYYITYKLDSMLMAKATKEKFNKSYSIIVWFSMRGLANWISNNNPRVWFDKNVISALRYSLNYISCIYNAFIREMNIIPIYGICKSNKNNKLNRPRTVY